jgi:hypothetical protein
LTIRQIKTETGEIIADVGPPGGGTVGTIQSVANARLIAAAPELLEQLIQLAESYTYWLPRYGDPESVNSQLMQNVRAAIAKATTP